MPDDCSILVVGGGVIGLSIAWELAGRGHEVTIIDKLRLGKKASWAGAGILAPANAQTATQPMDKLMGLGSDYHKSWTTKLRQQTGMDNGYRECGGLYVAATAGDKAALAGQMLNWNEYQIKFKELSVVERKADAGFLGIDNSAKIVQVPGESQICNPDHLRALANACYANGVKIIEECPEPVFELNSGRIETVTIDGNKISFDDVCLCAGAWSQSLLTQFDVNLPLIPVRGQMLMYELGSPLFQPIINVGPRYIVPRESGYVLVGSTLEEVGFDERTTPDKLEELQDFAISTVPALTKERCVAKWAGLRPATNDGFPFMGRLANFENGFVATGHFKCGLQMSPAVAVIMADLIEERTPVMDIAPFDPSRLDFCVSE